MITITPEHDRRLVDIGMDNEQEIKRGIFLYGLHPETEKIANLYTDAVKRQLDRSKGVYREAVDVTEREFGELCLLVLASVPQMKTAIMVAAMVGTEAVTFVNPEEEPLMTQMVTAAIQAFIDSRDRAEKRANGGLDLRHPKFG